MLCFLSTARAAASSSSLSSSVGMSARMEWMAEAMGVFWVSRFLEGGLGEGGGGRGKFSSTKILKLCNKEKG